MVVELFLLLFSILSFSETDGPFSFRVEFSKQKFFQGELVTANFILEAPSERAVEIEVMKFPEFRGFWSENLVLRQGPVHLMAIQDLKKRKAVALVGSYSLSSMLGMKSPKLEPMKILVKTFGEPPLTLTSQGDFPNPAEPPPIPKHLNPIPFSGAVGTFSFRVNQTQIPFRKNQPFLIRGELQGEGNFSEINTLPLSTPPEMTLISKSSFSEAVPGRSRKVFEWVLSTEKEVLGDWDPRAFLFFNPEKKSYQKISFPKIHFVELPETALPKNILRLGAISFAPEGQWKNQSFLKESSWLWVLQGLIGLSFLIRIIYVQITFHQERKKRDPHYRRKLLFKKATSALKNQNWEEFLSSASTLARELVQEKHFLADKESLLLFIEADNQLRFSPSKNLMISPDDLQRNWQSLGKTLQKPQEP